MSRFTSPSNIEEEDDDEVDVDDVPVVAGAVFPKKEVLEEDVDEGKAVEVEAGAGVYAIVDAVG